MDDWTGRKMRPETGRSVRLGERQAQRFCSIRLEISLMPPDCSQDIRVVVSPHSASLCPS